MWRTVGELRGSDVVQGGIGVLSAAGVPERERPGEVRPGEAVLPGLGAWVSRAVCRGVDPELLFVRGAAQRAATVICRHCPVQVECLADALDNRVPFGVWGGLTERERRALLRARPDVGSWVAHLRAVRAAPGDQVG